MSAAWPPIVAAERVRRKRTANAAQRAGLVKAVKRSHELRRAGELDERHGAALVASLGPNEGFPTWSSSPIVMLTELLISRGR